MASLGHLNLLRNNSGIGGVKQLISSSSSSFSPSSWSLLSREITINSFFSSNSCFTTFASEIEDPIKPRNHSLLSSAAPCLLIPSPEDDDNLKDEVTAAIAKDLNTGEKEKFNFTDYCFYSLADRKLVGLNNVRSKSNIVTPHHAVWVGSSHGWLAYLDPSERSLFLTNPLVSPAPPTIRLPRLPWSVDPKSLYYSIKLVMSSAPSYQNEDCIIMVSIGGCNYIHLLFCKLGDSSWTELEADHGLHAYSSKDHLFYSRNYSNGSKFAAWDLRNSCSPRRIDIHSPFAYGMPDYPKLEKKKRENYLCGSRHHYLVVESHSGDVLLVSKYIDVRSPLRTLRIDVYRLNAAKRGWDYVTDLGDGVVFVGLNQPFHLSASDFDSGVLIPNSIYFTPEGDRDTEMGEMGIYSMRDFTVTPVFPSHLHLFNKIRQPHPIWFTPNPLNN